MNVAVCVLCLLLLNRMALQQAKLDLERLGRHWKAEVMPETNKMDPVVHALNFRSDQAQVLQLRAKIINSKALYDEFCKVCDL